MLVVVYSDNFCVSGLQKEAAAIRNLLGDFFGFTQEESYVLTDVVGLEREAGFWSGRRAVLLHQTQYALHMVKEFEQRHLGGRELRGVDTPMALREEDDPDRAALGTPVLKGYGSEYGGKLVWLSRGSRYDLATVAKRVTQRLLSWERSDDAVTATECWCP